MATGAAGRIASAQLGYLFGHYGKSGQLRARFTAMAYHVGADLRDLECFQVQPAAQGFTNGPAWPMSRSARRLLPPNAYGERLFECDYLVRPDELEFSRKL